MGVMERLHRGRPAKGASGTPRLASWRRLALGAALAAMLPAGAAWAETLRLTYDAVTVITRAEVHPVLDSETHVVGTGAFRGLALVEGGGVARHRYEGWFDLTAGSGPFHGYALWVFDDGSEIRATYEGRAEGVDGGAQGARFTAAFVEVTGTGRFEGARGTGGFEGRRYDPVEAGGATHLEGHIDLVLP
ncbi:MAG: hypothetical protein AAFV96_02160 [Pseudomonadota bacterium]